MARSHNAYPNRRCAEVYPRELRERYLVPYCDHGPIGWYAEVVSCRLMTRRALARLIGAEAMAARDHGRDPARRPTHYYAMRLGTVHDGMPVAARRWRGLITARGPQGAPSAATWGELWGRMREGLRAEG